MHLEVSHCGPPGLGRGCGLRVPWRLIGTGRRCEKFYFPVISGHFRSFGPVGLLAQWQITGACKGNRDGETPENPSQIVPFRPILGISLRLTGVGRMRVAGAGWHKDALLSPLRVRVGPGLARVLRAVSNNGREASQGLARGGCQLQGPFQVVKPVSTGCQTTAVESSLRRNDGSQAGIPPKLARYRVSEWAGGCRRMVDFHG